MSRQPLILAALALALFLAAACTSGGPPPAGEDTPGTPALLLSNAPETLAASSQAYTAVRSVRIEMEALIEVGSAGGQGRMLMTYLNEAPRAHSTMSFEVDRAGETASLPFVEMIIDGDMVYTKTFFFGDDWLVASGEEYERLTGFNPSVTSPDFAAFLENLDEANFIGEEVIEGQTLARYEFTIDTAAIDDPEGQLSAFSESWGSTVPESLHFEIWIQTSDLLPYQMVMTGETITHGDPAGITMTARYMDYNEPLSIPPPPRHAQPLREAFGELDWQDLFGPR